MRAILFVLSIVLLPFLSQAQPRVIAHRGYWQTQGSAQNSIASLQKAAKIGVFGSEFDVNVTADGVAIVNHDGHINKKVIDKTPYSEFKDVKLSNGETLPTLEQYLTEGAKHPEMKLILEIKSGSTPELEVRAVDIILAEVEKAGVAKQTEYIAFSRNVVETLLKRNRKLTVAYLNGDISPKDLKKMGCKGLDYHYKKFYKEENLISDAKKNKIFINVWTVNEDADIQYMIDNKVDYITSDVPEKVQKFIAESAKK